MLARLANVTGWACSGCAALLLLLVAAGLLFGDPAIHWLSLVFATLLAVAVWSVGRAIRYVVGEPT